MALLEMQRRGLKLQEIYYHNQMGVEINLEGYVNSVISNSYQDLLIQPGSSILKIFNEIDRTTFLVQVSQAVKEFEQVITFLRLVNGKEELVMIIPKEDSVFMFLMSIDHEILPILKDFMSFDKEKRRISTELSNRVMSLTSEQGIFEEIMKINNTLVNTKRELTSKNRQLEQLNKELNKMSLTDALTGIYNRRKFFEDVSSYSKTNKFVLYMIDVNNLKAINDDLGHAIGDKALCLLSSELKNQLTLLDGNTYRLGGDEFSCIVSLEHSPKLNNIFIDINQKLQEIHSYTGISYGCVEVDGLTNYKNFNIEEYMIEADKLMYKMKKQFYQQCENKNREGY